MLINRKWWKYMKIPIDKQLHFLCSFAILVGVTAFTKNIHLGYLTALAFGIGKEWYDSRQKGNYWSWGDLVADVLGITAGIIIRGI